MGWFANNFNTWLRPTRENYWRITPLVTKTSLFRATHILLYILYVLFTSLTWLPVVIYLATIYFDAAVLIVLCALISWLSHNFSIIIISPLWRDSRGDHFKFRSQRPRDSVRWNLNMHMHHHTCDWATEMEWHEGRTYYSNSNFRYTF